MQSVASIKKAGARWEARIYRINSDGSRELTTVVRGSLAYVRYLTELFSDEQRAARALVAQTAGKPGDRLRRAHGRRRRAAESQERESLRLRR